MALAIAAILAFPDLGQSFLPTSAVVKARGVSNNEALSTNASIPAYGWNLNDHDLPLLSLPDHVGSGVDLSLTYSMNQFRFPLFQSIQYNERTRKYFLMVIPTEGRRTVVIELEPVAGGPRFESPQSPELSLVDQGETKVLSTQDGTVYIFVKSARGEFHCTQIKDDHKGVLISLKYTKDASINMIVDAFGRTIRFHYTGDYLASITQTWGLQSVKRKTWAITNDATVIRPEVKVTYAASEVGKRIPTNALRPAYTAAMVQSDLMLARIFGEAQAVAAGNSFEPLDLARQYSLYRGDLIGDEGKILPGHLTFAMHLYGSPNGTGDTAVYVPTGFTSHSDQPTPTDAVVTFFYPRLGKLTNVTLAVFHVLNFQLNYEDGRVRIGKIGGRGGSLPTYRHAHLEFYRGNTGLPRFSNRRRLRIDPAAIFGLSPELLDVAKQVPIAQRHLHNRGTRDCNF
jgi:hypothetical protein